MERLARTAAIGPYGYLFFFAWGIVLATLTEGIRLAFVLAIVFFFWWKSGGRWQELSRVQLWFLVVLPIVFGSILLGEKDIHLGNAAVSSAGFWIGVWVALRMVAMLIAVEMFTRAVSVTTLARLFEDWGMGGLGFAFAMAVNLLPTMARTVEDVAIALRLRGGLRCERWRALRLFLITVTVNALRHGDMVVEAAEARGFSTLPRPRTRIGWQPGDIALAAALVASGIMLLGG